MKSISTMAEINGREIFTLVPLGVIVIVVGVYPRRGARHAAHVLGFNSTQIVIPHLHG